VSNPSYPRSFDRRAIEAAPGLFVVLWSTGFIGARMGLPYAEPLTFLALRTGAAVVLLALLIAATRPAWPGWSRVGHSAVAGILVHGVYLGGVFVAMRLGMSAGIAALIVALQPVLLSTLARRWFGERVSVVQWAGLALGLVGVYFVVRGKIGSETALVAWPSAFAALLGITVGTLYQRRFGADADWRPDFLVQYGAACALFTLGAFAFESRAVQWTGEFLFALAWLVVVLSFGAVWLLYFLIRRAAATRVGSLFYLTPPVTALMAWVLFDEWLEPLAILGMAVCVAGVFLVNWRSEAN
jgi:drug/metabolite transporter (DMT)-like permease